jgi:hypothetical protein
MSRSADATSACGLITQMTNGINNTKSNSTYDIESSILKDNNKYINMITNGNFSPLESVKEDECLEINKKVKRKFFFDYLILCKVCLFSPFVYQIP